MSTKPPKVLDAKPGKPGDVERACAWMELPEQRCRWGTPARMNAWSNAPEQRQWFVLVWGEPNAIVYATDIGLCVLGAARLLGFR